MVYAMREKWCSGDNNIAMMETAGIRYEYWLFCRFVSKKSGNINLMCIIHTLI